MNLTNAIPSRSSLAILAAAGLITLCAAVTSTAGIQGSGRARVTAFGPVEVSGTVVVNGVAYDASSARVVIDGHPAALSELHEGHLVAVKGTLARTCSRVWPRKCLVSDVLGEITAVDANAGTILLLGQSVRVTDATSLDPRIEPASVAGLRPGMIVDVSALGDSSGQLIASRVDLEGGLESAQARGVIAGLDATNHTFRVNDLSVDYSGANIEGTLAEGAIVTVQGATMDGGTALIAASAEVFSGYGVPGEKGDLEGIITAFASNADFDVNGQPVLADAGTVYVLHGYTLAADTAVHVTGRFNASGLLVADRIDTKVKKGPKVGPHSNPRAAPPPAHGKKKGKG